MSREHEKVGIIMPAYNQGYYIDEAIESLKNQTFQDFIVHIVDDGSNDDYTSSKLKTIKYDKAKLFLNKKNEGVVKRQNEHFNLLKNEYIMIFCADDKILPTFLEKTVEFLDNNLKYGACGTAIETFGAQSKKWKIHEENNKLPGMFVANGMLGSSVMRKKALDSIDLNKDIYIRYQDRERWIAMLAKGWRLKMLNEHLFQYRKHDKSLSANTNIELEMDIRNYLYDKYKDVYNKYSKELFLLHQQKLLEYKEKINKLTIIKNNYKKIINKNKKKTLKYKITKILKPKAK